MLGLTSYGQSFQYSFKDPCDGNLKTVTVPSGQNTITVTYFNQIKSFSQDDFSNGAFEQWVNESYTTYKDLSPCTGVAFTKTIAQNQSMAATLTGIINTISNLSFPDPNTPDPDEPEPTPDVTQDNNSDNSTPESTPSSDNNSDNNSTPNNDGGNGGGGGGNNNTDIKNNNSPDNNNDNGGGGGSDVMSGTQNSVKSSGGEGGGGGGGNKNNSNNSKASSQKQNVLKPTVVGSSDLMLLNSTDKSKGGKMSGGYTSTRWDGAVTHGLLFDYSTQIQGPNITFFRGWIKKKSTTLLSNTVSIGFEGKGALYNSVAVGQLRGFKNLKVIYLAAGSYGHIYKQKLIGTSVIIGTMYDFKVTKFIGIKLTGLFVYSPYMQYYNDMLLKSPFVILPSIGTNLSITKNFKFNANLGGAYQVKSGALNYSLSIGTRIAL